MSRPMPAQGFYVFNDSKYDRSLGRNVAEMAVDLSDPSQLNIVYCSGTTKGNYYWDPRHHGSRWNFLTWTCVPSVKDAAKLYDYYPTNVIADPVPSSKA